MLQHIESAGRAPHARAEHAHGDELWADVTELAEAVIRSSSVPDGFVRGELPIDGRRARVYAGVAGSNRARPTTVVVVIPPAERSPPAQSELRSRFGLTPREVEVALLLAARRSNKEIARHLSIAPKTAARHTQSVMAKLDTSSRRDVASILGWSPRTTTLPRRRRRARSAWTA